MDIDARHYSQTRQPRARGLRLLAGFWTSGPRRWASALLLAFVLLTAAKSGIAVGMSFLSARIFNAIQAKDVAELWTLAGYLGLISLAFFLVMLSETGVRMRLQLDWREWLTRELIGRFTADQRFLDLSLSPGLADNPDQRIAEDARIATADAVTLGGELLSNILQLGSFIAILWTVSGSLDLSAIGLPVSIPGYMVWVAVAYSLVGTAVGHVIARSLTPLNFRQQSAEADFRVDLIRLRENAESIALLGGIAAERRALGTGFERLKQNFLAIIRYTRRLHGFQHAFGAVGSFFPLLVAMPKYLAGSIQLGGLMQIAGAFGQVQGSLTWFLTAYERLSLWVSCIDRLTGFDAALMTASERRRASAIAHAEAVPPRIEVHELQLHLPDGRELLGGGQFMVEAGERVMLTGRTGAGKSSLLRALSGLWIWGRGEVRMPAEGVCHVPQRPYLPALPLAAVLSYPASPGSVDTERVRSLLLRFDLGHLCDQLEQARPWSALLSAGEQQRLALIRAILSQPRWLLLDEATSALDAHTEQAAYRSLIELLPGTTVISVAHREALGAFHRRRLHLGPRGIESTPIDTAASPA